MKKELGVSLQSKLASLVVHVTEGTSPGDGHPFDGYAARAIAIDPEVVEWLATIDPALLPVRR